MNQRTRPCRCCSSSGGISHAGLDHIHDGIHGKKSNQTFLHQSGGSSASSWRLLASADALTSPTRSGQILGSVSCFDAFIFWSFQVFLIRHDFAAAAASGEHRKRAARPRWRSGCSESNVAARDGSNQREAEPERKEETLG